MANLHEAFGADPLFNGGILLLDPLLDRFGALLVRNSAEPFGLT